MVKYHNMKLKVKPYWNKFFLKNKNIIEKILDTLDYQHKIILPPKNQIFRAFEYSDIPECKLCLIGQDPYTSNNNNFYYADGLAYSVDSSITKLPGSLQNIFKELKNCYPEFDYSHGSLERWVKEENVILLNSSLTVIVDHPKSHTKRWKDFTDKIIQELDSTSNCIFLLVGQSIINKSILIRNKKRIITCCDPSSLGAHRGFIGSKIFLKINQLLKELGQKEINFQIH